MSEIKRVKIDSILESQIPEFVQEDSPLFVEFLRQYYKSLEYQSGTVDLAVNLKKYKNIEKFNNTDLTTSTTLTDEVLSFDDVISVTSTVGWPDTYGLLKINDEIITYTSKTENSFVGCIRGFSGVDNIESFEKSSFLNFSSTSSAEHQNGSVVTNLSNLFLVKFFEKYKLEFLPGFENRDFNPNVSIENVLINARNFYLSKGTDTSYKFLFQILYGSDIEVINPNDYTIKPSSDTFFVTKNILVEKIFGDDPVNTKGNFLLQELPGIGTASASIYNIEYRPVSGKDLYEISLDSSSISGTFVVTGQTKVLETIPVGADNIIVDSTVGFSKSGKILAKPENSDFIEISYTDKTTNQFLGVTGVTKELKYGLSLVEDKFAYSYVGFGNTSRVDFRVLNVIENIDIQNSNNLKVGDTIKLVGFGQNLAQDFRFNSWITNIPTEHNVKSFSQETVDKFRLFLHDEIIFYKEEFIKIYDENGEYLDAQIIDIDYNSGDAIRKFSATILVQIFGLGSTSFNVGLIDKIQKIIYKTNHQTNYFPNINKYPSGIQNTYIDKNSENFYVTSTGIPNYTIFLTDDKREVQTFEQTDRSAQYVGLTSILNVPSHNYVNGNLVYYDTFNYSNSGVSTGFYYVSVYDSNNIKLSFSKADVFSKKYVEFKSGISGDTIVIGGYENKNLEHQRLVRKFPFEPKPSTIDDVNERTTKNRAVGMLVNGTELLSPTYFDENIFYGKIDFIDVTNGGSGYDVVNPPPIDITDVAGVGAKAHVNLSGKIESVKLISPGVGYQSKPKINISGGNGKGCSLESNLVSSRITQGFKADVATDTPSNSISLLTPAIFDDGEEVIYNSNTNSDIPGIVNGSFYYVGIITETRIKLYNNKTDAVNKTNEVNLTGISSGFHFFSTSKNKNTITEIYVKNPGEGYSNRTIKVPSVLSFDNKTTGINTFDSYIYARNHGFSNAELVVYSTTDTPISGLSTENYYHVSVIDKNRFKLSLAGVANSISDDNYFNQRYVKFDTLGVGTHSIAYPPIVISVESVSSLGSTSIITPVLEPVVLGSIDDVYVIEGGVGYGCTDVINFHRRPDVGISSIKSEALLKPIVVDGKIVDVKIVQRGLGYRIDSDIFVSGSGTFAKIEPVIDSEGRLSSVQIVDGGVGYGVSDTTLLLKNRGVGAKFLANVTQWTVDQVEKLGNLINVNDDGVLLNSRNELTGLQFCSYYVPKKLRYQLSDNFTQDNKETDEALRHSPILGYAYDGNPIYGPYGYASVSGGAVRQIISSYSLNVETNTGLRPPSFVPGYFVNDYSYNGFGDLDEYNGRWCVTPEYPNGVYAYFYSVDVDISRVAKNRYPYIIGPQFNNKPVRENFLPSYNQDENIFTNEIVRNTGPYYLNYAESSYELIDKVFEDYKQEFRVSKINTGTIEDISIFSKGKDYKIGDKILVDNKNTDGYGANIVVSEIGGKEVQNASIVKRFFSDCNIVPKNNTFKVVFDQPHGLVDKEPISISGISTISLSLLEKTQIIKVNSKTVQLLEDIGLEAATGVSTFIKVKDVSGFSDNDFIGIGTENLLITKVSPERSGFYVNRLENTGIHTAGLEFVTLKPKTLEFSNKLGFNKAYQENYVTFFNPIETVGTGTDGVTRTVVGFGGTFESRNLRPRTIYIPGHKFYTGQPLTYNIGLAGTSLYVNQVGSAVSFPIYNNQTVYAVNFDRDHIGISTVGFTTISGIGTDLNSVEFWTLAESYGVIGAAHSLTTQFDTITCSVTRNSGVVTTKTDHGLTTSDIIDLKVEDSSTNEYSLYFDNVNRKILVNKISFTNSEVSTDNNTIDITSSELSLKNGDKVAYFAENAIGGLQSSNIYFVLKKDNYKISLCNYKTDINSGNEISFTSFSAGGSQDLYLVNPPITVYEGSKIKFDLSDPSLVDLRLEFYSDNTYTKRVELIGSVESSFAVTRFGTSGSVGAYVQLDTSIEGFPNLLFYTLKPASPLDTTKNQLSFDTTVVGSGQLKVVKHPLTKKLKTDLIIDSKTFSFNSDKKLTDTDIEIFDASTPTYSTVSKTATGPIEDIKINFEGRGYTRLPLITGVDTEKGRDAVLRVISNNIGKVEIIDRVKDGFDYPTDPTLSPQLGGTVVVGIKDIRTIDKITILDGGKNYNSAPLLFVKGNSEIELSSGTALGSVVDVQIIKNSTSLAEPLEIIPIFNSNGYDIDNISVVGDSVTLELLNSPTLNPLVTIGYGKTEIVFPFSEGDEIFVENCKLTPETSQLANFNSEKYDYSFFTVTGVNTTNYTITYSMSGISTGTFGTYSDERPGTVVNKKDMASFEMVLVDDVTYQSSEKVTAFDFSARVLENGWTNELNQLRVTDAEGVLKVGDKITGEESNTVGTVEYLNSFIITSDLGVLRDKTLPSNLYGILNDSQQRISDNFYYQKFAYSLRSDVPYGTWRESVRSIVHPSGFKEFSDYTLFTKPSENPVTVGIAKSINMKPTLSQSDSVLSINVDSENSFYNKNNFALVYEDLLLDNGYSENVFIDIGPDLKPFILNKTNKIVVIDDIGDQFTGTREFVFRGRYADAANLLDVNREFIQEEVVSFVEFNYPNIGLSTTYSREKCLRDTGFIVDAVSHDLKYNSNNKSVEAGLAYWNAGSSYVTNETEETLFAYTYVKFIGQYVINNQTPPTLYQTSVTQTFNFDVIQDPLNYDQSRYKDSRNLIVANKREIQDRSLAKIALEYPDFYFPGDLQTNELSRYYDGYRLIQQNKQEIIDYAWDNTLVTYPGVSATEDKCKRDLGYMIDAVSLDVFAGGNNYSRKFVNFYFENGLPISNGLLGEEVESVFAFNLARVGMQSAVSNQLSIQDLTVSPGQPIYGVGTTVTNISSDACTDVQADIQTLVAIITNVISAGSTSGLPAENVGTYTTGGSKCFRDLGYIIDGVAQDLSYGTNQHTIYNTKKYFDGAGAARTDGLLGEEAQSLLVFDNARIYMKQAITNQLYSRDLTITADPVTGFNTDPNSCADVQTNIDTLVGILTVAIGNSSLASLPEENFGTVDCADVRTSLANYVGIITNIIGFGTAVAPEIYYPKLSLGGAVVGLSTFKLTNNGTSLFKHVFDSSDAEIVDIETNTFNIVNHNYQIGHELSYVVEDGSPIGIATTSYVGVAGTILMQVGNIEGTAILENGYPVAITTTVTGVSTVLSPVGPTFKQYTQVVGNGTTGTDATFNVLITYSPSTGQPLSTSVILTAGGSGYSVGESVSIAGTFMGGVNPTNDLTFVISNVGPSGIQTQANQTYLDVPSSDSNGARFNVTRDGSGYVSDVQVVNGGSGYSQSSVVSIAGTYIGGGANDYVEVTPVVLGVDKLPSVVYSYKLNDNQFALLGLSTSASFLEITNLGTGNHSLSYTSPNSSSIISIDGVVQPPIRTNLIDISLTSAVSSASTTIISVSSGITSVSPGEILNIDQEYMLIKTLSVGSSEITVDRGFLGSSSGVHTVGAAVTVLVGSYNIIGDTIFFTEPPYGPTGPVGLETRSSFNGRVFSRQFDGTEPIDQNLIIDDISRSFTGIAATDFTITVNGSTTTTLYNDINASTLINNIPLIFIDNVFQVPNKDFTVDGTSANVLRFLSGTPSAGKISKVSISTSFGYQPRIVATADAVVSVSGTISSVVLDGLGSGYRNPPAVSLASTVGTGASLVAVVGTSGTTLGQITEIQVVDGGTGYAITSPPRVVIGIPTGYSNLNIDYIDGTSGNGQRAKVTVTVGQGSSITSFKFDDPGIGYKTGDQLKVVGIPTVTDAVVEELVFTVDEVQSSTFNGLYPGQFIIFDDISSSFNNFRTKFTLSITESGIRQVLNLNTVDGSDLDITNNIFVFINDILQAPQKAYTFRGSRIIFTEPPVENSSCTVLYYRGSYRDVEEITPPETLKPGDVVQIKESRNDLFDQDQTERIIKNLNTSDQFTTFVYGGVGIVSDVTKSRPLNWKKQTSDRVISGSLYSKSRNSLKSRLYPTATVIKDIAAGDTEIYVDNAFPLFSEVDGLNENLRDFTILENKLIQEGTLSCTVSGASTVSSISVTFGGVGYANTLSPKVVVSESAIKLKDPVYNWSSTIVSGVTTTDSFNAVSAGKQFVAVGNSSLYSYSFDGTNWVSGSVGVGSTVNLTSVHAVGAGVSDVIYTVGTLGKVSFATGYSNTMTSWTELPLKEDVTLPGAGVIGENASTYVGTLNGISFGSDSWVTVGTGGSIFSSPGLTTSKLTNRYSGVIADLNGVVYGNGYFTSVGNNGTVITSNDGTIWDIHLNGVPLQNFNDVGFDGTQILIVGDNATIVKSLTRDTYQPISNNINPSEDIIKISYTDGLYLVLTSVNKLYYSFDLSDWTYRSTLQSNNINDLVSVDSLLADGGYVAVGAAATIIKTTSTYHKATAESTVSNGEIVSVTVTDGGFGYVQDNVPVVIVESDNYKKETVKSFKVTGDYGTIVGVNTFLAGTPGIGTTSPKLEFVLQSETYDNSTLGIGYSSLNSFGISYSQLTKGDYFVISNSNVQTDGNLVAISTFLGGMSNYPNSIVGTATSFIDGVYVVEDVTTPSSGIVTVTCHFAPDYDNAVSVSDRGEYDDINLVFSGINTNGYYGRYSWSKLYDFQNRSLSLQGGKSFETYTENGLTGLSTAPKLIRTKPVTSQ